MATVPTARITPEEYLDLDRRSEQRSEYHGGEMFVIEAATINHRRIQGNLYAGLRERLKDGACEAFLSSLRISIPRPKRYTYPDLTIGCGKFEFEDKQRDTLMNPVVIFEILSPSTEGFDRGEKFSPYRAVDSLREYILVSQDRMLVERYRRQNDRQWLYEALSSPTAELMLEPAGVSIPLNEIFGRVEVAAS